RLTLTVFLEQVTTQLSVDAADVMLLDPHDRTLYYAAGRGFQTTTIQREHLRLGEGRAGLAVQQRRIVSARLDRSAPLSKRTGQLMHDGYVSYFGVPLVAKGEPLGVLEIFHRSPLNPDADWLDFLEALAGQAAIAIDSAHLWDDLQRSNTDLQLAYDATI